MRALADKRIVTSWWLAVGVATIAASIARGSEWNSATPGVPNSRLAVSRAAASGSTIPASSTSVRWLSSRA
jgi:hypothetical protein